ncbi:unnamed protein product [Gordionus sp. m RMFG-2023]
MAIVNTYFQKREDHIVTYRCGKHFSQIDYLLIRRKDLWRIKDCKVIPGEEIVRQHRPLVMDLERKVFPERRKIYEPRIRYEMLKDMPTNDKYHQKASTLLGARKLERNVDDDWETLTADIKETAIQILGQTKGGKALNKELWWWDQSVRDFIERKKFYIDGGINLKSRRIINSVYMSGRGRNSLHPIF